MKLSFGLAPGLLRLCCCRSDNPGRRYSMFRLMLRCMLIVAIVLAASIGLVKAAPNAP